jgi:hypothetical protein
MENRRFLSLVGMFALVGLVWPTSARADDGHTGMAPTAHQAQTPEQQAGANALVEIVRRSTEQFRDISVALAVGYVPQFGCVSGSHEGAMGVHLVNGPLVADVALDPTKPELLVYEPRPHGEFRLVAADFLVLSSAWHAGHEAPPELMGQLFHLFDEPNRFRLPAFYTLHVWAWKDNPQGTFANWNPKVSCDHYDGEDPRPAP